MDYSRIINRSFEIAWKHKTLWLLGYFSGALVLNADAGWLSEDFKFPDIDLESGKYIPSFDFDPSMMAFIILGFLLFFSVFMVFHFISVAGLVDAANRIVRGGAYRLFDSISSGASKLLRFIGLSAILFAGSLIFIFTLIMAVVGSFAIHTVAGIIFLLFCIPLYFIFLFYLITIGFLGQRAIVVRDVSIGDGIEEAYYLLNNNTGKCVTIAVLYVLIMIGIAILSFMIFGLPAMILGLLSQSWLVVLLSNIVVIPLVLIASGFVGTAMANIYTLFYFELLEPGILSRDDQISTDNNPGILP